MKTKLSYSKLAGAVSTAALVTATVAPTALHIPVPLRPWIFLFTIAWALLIASGVFSS